MDEGRLQFKSKNLAERYIVDPHKPRRPVVGISIPVTVEEPEQGQEIAQQVEQLKSIPQQDVMPAGWLESRRTLDFDYSESTKKSLLGRLQKVSVSFKTILAVSTGLVLVGGFITFMMGLRVASPPIDKTSDSQTSSKPISIEPVSSVLGASTSTSNDPNTQQADTKGVGPVSEERLSDEVVDQYVVSASHIRYMSVPAIGINKARVMRNAVAIDGSIELPKNVWDAGWYESSALPTDKQGSVLVLGHIKGETGPGLFYDLYRIKVDDVITLTLGDGTIVKYKVVAKEDVLSDDIDKSGVLKSRDGSASSLTLMTAVGEKNPTTGLYEKRQAVFAIRSN